MMAALSAFLACSPETRYETLSFFFDGVPLPPEHSQMKGAKDNRLREPSDVSQFRQHGPYAAKLCEACHRSGGGDLIMPVEELCINCHGLDLRKKNVHGPVATGSCRICHDPHGTGKAYLLISEPTDFCFYCHDRKEVSSHEAHKAAAGISCTDCHNPHASDNAYLLL
jgi:predicted CXXCH cytochrome family protein